VPHAWSPVAIIAAAYGGAVRLASYDDEILQREATKVAQASWGVAGEVGLKAQPEVAEITYQDTCHAILDVADQHDAELIVLGARGASTFKSVILGSVSHSVTQHAHLPVPIVPNAAGDERTSEPAEHSAATA
jgi:nucleotide-binding universal stress UspA family protein